jgi:signal transduction histidine kinase
MSVRLRIALTIFVTGVITALGVIVTVVLAFQRFEHENLYERGDAFLGRVVALHDDMLDLHARNPDDFSAWLGNLLLFAPNTQLYLLGPDGAVLAHTGRVVLPAGFRVALAPVQQAVAAVAGSRRAPYVMGDDPEHMNANAVITARALQRATIAPSRGAAGYLYLVAQQPAPPAGRLAMFRSSLAGPALASVLAVILLTTALTAWIVATVTRPLRVLSDEVAAAARDGFDAGPAQQRPQRHDEFGRLQSGFQMLLATLRRQWDELRTLDHFRREGVSNLSHDLRSPLTATVACLETLDRRWAGDATRQDDRALVEVALRNTRNAAQLVRSLGDLALLDEPAFQLKPMRLDLGEVLDDITLRFADRAARQGVTLACEAGVPAPAEIDIELFERAVANLVDNALKFTASGGRITLAARPLARQVLVSVADSGSGVAAEHQERLFDRLYRSPADTQRSEGGKGLGLAIVKRIAELHHGSVTLASAPGAGTTVTMVLPAAFSAGAPA